MLGCRTLRLESQSSAGLRMQPYPRSPDLVWPGHLHGAGCLSARAVGTGFPTVGLRWWLGPGCGWSWVLFSPARRGWGLGWVCLGSVCGIVPLLPAVCGVRGWALVSARFRDVCGFVRVSLAPRRFRFRCAVWACVLGSGLGCAPLFLAGLSGCVFCVFFSPFFSFFFFSRFLGVPVPGLVVSPPVSFLFGWAAGFFFFLWVSACFGAPFPGGPLFLAWCCRFLLGGPPVPVWGSCLRCLLGGGFGLLLCFWRAVWWLCVAGVLVGSLATLAEVPVCFSPPLLAGFRCRWWWAVPATPGWGPLAVVVCGVWCVAVVCWWGCGWCVVWLVPRHSWRRFLCATPRHSWLGFAAAGGGRTPPLLAGVRWRRCCVVCGVWRWCVGGVVAGVWCGWSLATPGGGSCVLLPATPGWVSLPVVVGGPRHSWLGSAGGGAVWCVVCGGVCWWGCGWCVVWLVPRHSWRRSLCATPRHSWLGFAAAGGGRTPPLLAGVRWRRCCVVCGVWRWCVGGVVAGVWCGWSLATPGGGSCVLLPASPGWVSLPVVVGGPRHSWLGSACGGGVSCVVCGVWWWCVGGVVAGVWCGWSLATAGGGSFVLLPATPGLVSLPLVVGGPRHSWLGSVGGGGVWCVVCGVWWWWVVGVVVGVWRVAVVCCWGCGWCAVWLVPRHSWLWSLCATPRHSWPGFAADGGGWSPPLLAGVRWRRWCVVCGVLVGSLATPGGGSCVLLPATPGWVSLAAVVCGVWCVVCGGGVLLGLWLVCGVVGPSPLLAEVPVCYSPPLLAGFRCRWWWAVPATPGWGPLAAVVCGVWCVVCGGGVLLGLWLVCSVVGPSPLLAEVPVCYSPPLLAGFRCRWSWAVPAIPGWGPLAAVVCGVWCVGGVPRHSWRRFQCATPRHSWLGFAAAGGGRSPPLLAGVRWRRWRVVSVRVRARLAGSGGPASRARFGAPHLFLWPLCLTTLPGPLRAGVAPLSFAAVAVPRWLFFSASRCLALRALPPRLCLPLGRWLLFGGCSPAPLPFCVSRFSSLLLGALVFLLFFFFFFPFFFFLCAPPLSLVFSGFRPRVPWASALALFALFAFRFWALRALVALSCFPPGCWLLPRGCCPPPFVFRGFHSCRSVLCAVWCCASLGAVLCRGAARCVARCSAVVCCVALVWCRCLLRRALWRCPSPWGPVLCGAVFCGVPPRCVLCAVCVLSWRGGACCCSPLCLVLCVSRGAVPCVPCALRSVRCCAPLCWCARVLLFVWCVLLLAPGAVVRCCVLCCFLWCAVVRCWVWWPVVVCWWRVSVSVSLSGRVVCFPVVGVVCCGALLSCVVFCGAMLSRGAVLLCSGVVLRCCWGLLCPPVGCRAVLCCAVGWLCCLWPGGGVCVMWCSFPRAVRSLSSPLCALRCLVVLAVVPCFPVSCAVALCCRVVLCCRFAVLFVLALPSCGLSCGASVVCAVVGASCCGVSLCVVVSPWAFCGVVVLLWCVVVSCCAVRCPVVSCALCRVLRCRAALRCCAVCFSFCPVFLC